MYCYHTFLCHLDGYLFKKHKELYSTQMVPIDPLAHGLIVHVSILQCTLHYTHTISPTHLHSQRSNTILLIRRLLHNLFRLDLQ